MAPGRGLTLSPLLVSLVIFSFTIEINSQGFSGANLSAFLAQLFSSGPSPVGPQPGCGGLVPLSSDRPAFIHSPSSRATNLRCTWKIEAPKGHRVKLTFEEFRLRKDPQCTAGYVVIAEKGNEGKKYCEAPPPLFSTGSSLALRFVTHMRFGDTGFRVRAEAVENTIVTIKATKRPKMISSPNFPDPYPNNHVEGWLIQSPDNSYLALDCRDGFSLEDRIDNSCRKDFLVVSLTGNLKFSDGKRYCGKQGPGLLMANNSMALLFRSDHSDRANVFQGFQCFFQAIGADLLPAGQLPTKPPPRPIECHCGQSNLGKRIVGGVMTEIHEFPWQAGLSTKRGYLFCGGTLINDRYVLTAAHCTRGRSASSLMVLLGDHDYSTEEETNSIKVGVTDIVRHSDYDTVTNNNDIGLLKLAKRVLFDHRMKPPCFTRPGLNYAGQQAVITGWGATSEGGKVTPILREVALPIISLEKCRSSYGKNMITENMLCAGRAEGGKDSCQGDSGGPMVWEHNNRWHLIGIVSWGYGCARPNTPGVYTRVDKYLDWIDKHTDGAKYCN